VVSIRQASVVAGKNKATPSKFLVSNFIDLAKNYMRGDGSLSIIHYKYLHEIRS